jgi:hypothetical protein
MRKEPERRCNNSLQRRAAAALNAIVAAAALKAFVAAACVLVAVAAAEPEQCSGRGEPASLIGKSVSARLRHTPRAGVAHHCAPARSRAGSRPQIILFGDSITEHASGRFGWAAELTAAYTRRADVINRGFSGYNSAVAW